MQNLKNHFGGWETLVRNPYNDETFTVLKMYETPSLKLGWSGANINQFGNEWMIKDKGVVCILVYKIFP